MKRCTHGNFLIAIFFTTTFLLGTTVAWAQAPATPADTARMKEEVNRFLDADEKAHRDHDIKALGDLYDDALVGIYDCPGRKEGAFVLDKTASLKAIEGAWKNPSLHIKSVRYLSREIHIVGDAAWITAINSLEIEGKPDEKTPFLLLAIKRESGWKSCFCMSLLAKPVLLVAKVLPDSRAEDAGVKAGDVLLSYENEPVDLNELRALIDIKKNEDPRRERTLTILRNGQERKLTVQPGQLGAEFAVRMAPMGEAKLAAVGQPHPAKEVLEKITDSVYRQRKYEPLFNSLCPEGFVGITIQPNRPTEIITAAQIRETMATRLEEADKNVDLAAFTLSELQAIYGANVGIIGGKGTMKIRKDGSLHTNPTGLAIYVMKDGDWRMAAALSPGLEMGLALPSNTATTTQSRSDRK